MKRINITHQDFEKIKQTDGFYLDKTKKICNLISDTSNSHYFFARPRRFGKSIMCSVMKNMFLGKKKLFKNLYAYDHRNWDETFPVIYISFASRTQNIDPDKYLQERIQIYIGEKRYTLNELTLETDVNFLLRALLKSIYQKTGKPSAIIIDEYDKPVLTHLSDPVKAEEMRTTFRNFYSLIKDSNEYIRFFRLSGLTKVMKMNIFSVLNNLNDISLQKEYADLIGFTQTEVEENFAEEIDLLAKENKLSREKTMEKIKERYNGFNFGDNNNTLYNPRDINNLVLKQTFKYYRADTGIPSGIKEYMETKVGDVNNLIKKVKNREAVLTENNLSLQNLATIDMSILFFQSGYLTTAESIGNMYKLKFPNKQAEVVFTEFFAKLIKPTANIAERQLIADQFYEGLFGNDTEKMQLALQKLFYEQLADTPGERTKKNPEGWMKSFVGALLRLSNIYRRGEIPGLGVRSDLLIVDRKNSDHCWIVECKVDETPEKAIEQIKSKYIKTVATKFKKISMLGINRNRKTEKIEVEYVL